MNEKRMDQIMEAISRGEITPEDARTLVLSSVQDAHWQATLLARLPAAPAATAAPWGNVKDTGLSPGQLAHRALVRAGTTDDEATQLVLEHGPEAFADHIAEETALVIERNTAVKKAEWLATAEGRRWTAEQAELVSQQEERTLALADRLLIGEGFSAEDLNLLDPADRIAQSGIESGLTDKFNEGKDDLAANSRAADAAKAATAIVTADQDGGAS